MSEAKQKEMYMARRSNLWPVALLAGGLLAPAVDAAGPVTFSISGTSLVAGSGYGIDASEPAGTLLDVRFATSPSSMPLSFSLDLDANVASYVFLFGSVDFQESDAQGGGITGNEKDNLGVTARFTFTDPTNAATNVIATGTAIPGHIADANANADPDYALVWAPVVVNFGNGGQFRNALDDLWFTTQGPQDLNATVTLLTAPTSQTSAPVPPTNGAAVPEPATLALLGLGLAGLGFSRRRIRA